MIAKLNQLNLGESIDQVPNPLAPLGRKCVAQEDAGQAVTDIQICRQQGLVVEDQPVLTLVCPVVVLGEEEVLVVLFDVAGDHRVDPELPDLTKVKQVHRQP